MKDSPDEIEAFVLAQFDKDEAVAREAHPGPWRRDYHGAFMHNITSEDGLPLITDGLMCSADVNHVINHDPASVLTDIASKRQILDDLDYGGPETGDARDIVVRRFAEPYASRDGYKATWRLS